MNIFLIVAVVFAGLESLALKNKWSRLEYIAKPGVMLTLFLWLLMFAGLEGITLWFAIGILLSLAGDVFLMISLEKLFLPGLVAFLFAHLAYMVGFNIPLPGFSSWGLILAVMIGWGGVRVMRQVLSALAAKGQNRLRVPIIVYTLVISLMLLSAMLKLTDLNWNAGAALLVSFGAFMFYLSDILLAWNKFVSPIRNGRIYNIGAYHMGQIMLIAGVILQFSG